MWRKRLLVLAIAVGVMAVCPQVMGQNPFLPLPRTQQEAAQMVKNVEDQSIPSNQPGLVYEEIRVARQKAEEFNNAKDRLIPQGIQQLDSVKISVPQTMTHLEQLAKSCKKKGIANEIKKTLDDLVSPFGVAFGADLPAFFAQIKTILASGDVCKTFTNKKETANLTAAFNADVDKAKQLYNDQRGFVDELQEAWSARLAKLEKLQNEQIQIFDLQKMVPWLVGTVCAFAVLMLLGIRIFDQGLQLELITSGQMIQFPTVMILLVIVAALAISKTIAENTVSALLGGIAGYVLSQGVGRAVAREAERRAAALPSAEH